MNFPTKTELVEMPLHSLQMIDIKTPEQEALIQHVINLKRQDDPFVQPIVTSDVPDIKTPADERKWQAILDERRERATAKPVVLQVEIPLDPVEAPTVQPESTEIGDIPKAEEITVLVVPEAVKPFCDQCDSKGVKHKKICPKSIK